MAPSSPHVSIITPSYNQASYLEAALSSVLAQDLKLPGGEQVRLEYIVVDGASSDGSPEIIQRYARDLAWWVSEPDAGQAQAINKGLRRARGDILAWLNSDDLYLPGAITSAVQALQADPSAGMVFGDAVTIDALGRPLHRLSFGDWGLEELACFRIICQPAVFMRRTVLEAAGPLDGSPGSPSDSPLDGPLDSSYHFMLDHHLWLRLARLAPIRHVPELWAAARHHAQAKNVAQAAAFSREVFRIFEWMQAQPGLAEIVQARRRQVEGGAFRLSARYLLDGGQPGAALRHYGRALRANPRYALQHWRRMAWAVLMLAGGDRLEALRPGFPNRHPQAASSLSGLPGIENWPGLALQAPRPGPSS